MTRQFCREKQSKNDHILGKNRHCVCMGRWMQHESAWQHTNEEFCFCCNCLLIEILATVVKPPFYSCQQGANLVSNPSCLEKADWTKGIQKHQNLVYFIILKSAGAPAQVQKPLHHGQKFNKKGQKRLRNLGKQCHNRI